MNSLYVLEITREEHLRLSPDASHLQIPQWGRTGCPAPSGPRREGPVTGGAVAIADLVWVGMCQNQV